MLRLENISKEFATREGARAVLSDVSLIVAKGETVALLGSSGSGKTTLLRIMLGLIPFERGYVKIDGEMLSSFQPSDWANRIGYVPQDGGLFPHLTGSENVALIAKLRGWSKDKIEKRMASLRALVDLETDVLARYPSEMSGGQKQRVALMRAALLDPPVLVLDEPMGALDPVLRRGLQSELKSIFRRLDKTVLLVTHDLGEAVYLAERLALLNEGRILQVGRYDDFLERPADPFVTTFMNAQRALPISGDAT